MSSPALVPTSHSVCAACGAAFRCGMTGADARCWCFELPHGVAVPSPAQQAVDAASCLCPACLKRRLGLSGDAPSSAAGPAPDPASGKP